MASSCRLFNADHADAKKRLAAVVKVNDPQGLNEQIDSEGGYLVQNDLIAGVDSPAFSSGEILSRVETTPISGMANGLTWIAVDDSTRADGSRRGGVSVNWTHEANSATASQPSFEERHLKLEKLTGLFYATEELLQDSAALTAEVSNWYVEEMRFAQEDAIVNGSGAGQPLGILNAPALVTVAKEGSQAADTILHANLAKMYMRMTPSSRSNAVWLINNDVWAQLLTLEDSGGTRPIFMGPGNQITDAPNGTIYGRPIIVTEHCQTLGNAGDIVFADLGRYRFIEKGGVDQTQSIHVRFVQGETAFRFKKRVNGEPRERTAVTPANGSTTVSPFVTLAARA